MPQLRETAEPFRPKLPERLASRTPDLETLVRGMYVRGLSTQDVGALYGETFGEARLSKSTVSRITQRLNQDFETWHQRDLSDLAVVYVFLDGQYHAARQGTDEKEGVRSAYALLEDGRPVLVHGLHGIHVGMGDGGILYRHPIGVAPSASRIRSRG